MAHSHIYSIIRSASSLVVVLALASALITFDALGPHGEARGATPSEFAVVGGALTPATGKPTPPSGLQASLLSDGSYATATLAGGGRVVLGGIGDYCHGWPTVRVSVDGHRVGHVTFDSHSRYGAHPARRTVAQGTHQVRITFVNDRRVRREPGRCDRNAQIGFAHMSIPAPPPPVPAPAPAPPAPAPPAPSPLPVRPGPSNTGAPDGLPLTEHDGSILITQDNTVIEGLDIHGFVNVKASNVTIRNSIIRGDGPKGALIAAYAPHTNLVVEDTTLVGAYPSYELNGVYGHNFTFRRVDISQVVDDVGVYEPAGNANVLIESSWLHGTIQFSPDPNQPDNKSHDDNVQLHGGSNVVLRGDTLEGAHNAGVIFTPSYGPVSNVSLIGNWLSGGSCTVNVSEKGRGPIQGITIADNIFGPSSIARCAVISPPSTPLALEGNVYEDTGQPISVRRGA